MDDEQWEELQREHRKDRIHDRIITPLAWAVAVFAWIEAVWMATDHRYLPAVVAVGCAFGAIYLARWHASGFRITIRDDPDDPDGIDPNDPRRTGV